MKLEIGSLQQLIASKNGSTEPLELVDYFFAKAFFPEGPLEPFLALAYLFFTGRCGHLCLYVEGNSIFPEPPKPLLEMVLKGITSLPEKAIHREGNRIYLKRNWECEELYLKHLKRIKDAKPCTPMVFSGENLSEEQKKACHLVSQQTLTLISGGPGTGKTTIAAALMEQFSGTIAVSAPTGKACANLRKKNFKATIKTLHALVKEPFLQYDLIIVDEASMVDAPLFAQFFSKVKTGARVVLLGDSHQLPSIEQGSVFTDTLLREKENVAFLTTCFRAELQEVITLAEEIKKGEKVAISPLPNTEDLLSILSEKLQEKTFSKFKVFSPLREGPYGVDTLNQKLYALKRNEKAIPIILTSNDSALDVYNGDFAILRGQEAHFEDGKVIPLYLLPSYEWGYLMSVHKAQGSEYEEVMILLPDGSEVFGREMIYTAVTRAKKRVSLFGKEETLELLLKKQFKRYSGINQF